LAKIRWTVQKKLQRERTKRRKESVARDPYEAGITKGPPSIRHRTRVEGRVVGVLNRRIETLGLHLIHPQTRCVKTHEIHEFLLTDEPDAAPGLKVDRIASIGFIEFSAGGVLVEGDKLVINGKTIGKIAGFDETHVPNHMNIVIKGRERITGLEWGIKGGDGVIFEEFEKEE
jgi:hypothetical protein